MSLHCLPNDVVVWNGNFCNFWLQVLVSGTRIILNALQLAKHDCFTGVMDRSFTLVGKAEDSPCNHVQASAMSCRIVEISAINFSVFFALLVLGYADGTQNYAIMSFEGRPLKMELKPAGALYYYFANFLTQTNCEDSRNWTL